MERAVNFTYWLMFIAALVLFLAHGLAHKQQYLNDLIPAIDWLKGVLNV
jgi:hypothetical protein